MNYAAETFNGTGFAGNYPHTTPQGNTVGWETNINGTDRSAAVDVRLGGVNYCGAGQGTFTYRIDLPATGSYAIQGAFGDQGFNQGPFTINLKDGTTVFATPVNSGSLTAGEWYAANGTLETSSANWATNNPNAGSGTDEISHSFTNTIFRIDCAASGSSAAVIASIFIRSAGGGFTPKFRKTLSMFGSRVGGRQSQAA